MRWRWLAGNFADPQYDLEPAEQRELTDLAHRKHMPARTLGAWTILGIVVPLLVLWKVIPLVLMRMGLAPQTPAHWVAFAVVSLVSWPLAALVYGHVYEKAVRRAMLERGYDVCIACGYLLRDLPADAKRCPECGRTRERPAGRTDQRAGDE